MTESSKFVYDFEVYNNNKELVLTLCGTPDDVINAMNWKSFKDMHDYYVTLTKYNDIMKSTCYECNWFGKLKKSKFPFCFNNSIYMKDIIKYVFFKPLLSKERYFPSNINFYENRMIQINEFRKNMDDDEFNNKMKEIVAKHNMIEIKSYDDLLSKEPCIYLLIFNKYHQAYIGRNDSLYSTLIKTIEGQMKRNYLKDLIWLKMGAYSLTDITKIYIKPILLSDIDANNIVPTKNELKEINEFAENMYQTGLEDDEEDVFSFEQCMELALEDWKSQTITDKKREKVFEEHINFSHIPIEYRFSWHLDQCCNNQKILEEYKKINEKYSL